MWDRCLNDQMFVYQENDLDRILDLVITNMTPQRSPSQKPVPANIIFLGARYAFYHSTSEPLGHLLSLAIDKINAVVERHQWDMTILAFWVSNVTLLLYYIKKDTHLLTATTDFQQSLAELINEIYILIIRDAERRMDRCLDAAILDHETIPGFEDVQFQSDWNLFRSKAKSKAAESPGLHFRPPSPKKRAQVSPGNITSLLSSTLFVLDLYDIHSLIISQLLSQLLYWLGAEIFNRIIANRKYLARTKAMQIRMNISVLEDWARANNRQPGHYESGSLTTTGEHTTEASKRHLAPVVQLLQWLQCFSSLADDFEALVGTLQQLPRLTPHQMLHTAKFYRAEVGEKGLSKSARRYIETLQKEILSRKTRQRRSTAISPQPDRTSFAHSSAAPPSSPLPMTPDRLLEHPRTASSPAYGQQFDSSDDDLAAESLLMDPALMLPFLVPTSTDMLVSFGAGFGGINKDRERKYRPSVPPEILAKLDRTLDEGDDASTG